MDALSEPHASARAARSSYRQSEAIAARLRMLSAVGIALAARDARGNGLRDALRSALDLLSFEDGLVIGLDGHAPVVCASHGQALPDGARPVDNGVMRVIAQDSHQPLVRERAASRLCISRTDGAGVEVLVPLRFNGSNAGVLALISRRPSPAPSNDDLGALQVVGVLLGAMLGAPSRPAPQSGVHNQLDALTPRELQVFALLPRGLTNAAMADELGIAAGTVKTHIERILQKLGLTDRTQAAVRAAECGYGS